MDTQFLTDFLTSPYLILTIIFGVFAYMFSDFGKGWAFAGGFLGLCCAFAIETVAIEYILVAMLVLLIAYGLYKKHS